jgi:cation:H+ antiporter
MITSIALIVLGLVLLIGGGESLIRGAVGIATSARLTPAVIGLTVVAAGTSVPELAVSAVAAFQGKVDITIGNVVGSNIFNIAFILGVSALIRPLAVTGNTIRLEYPVLVIVTLLCVAVCDHGTVARLDALLFVVIYVAFIAFMVNLVRGQLSTSESRQLAADTEEHGSDAASPPHILCSVGMILLGVVLLTGGAHATVTGAIEIGRFFGLTERVIGLTIVAAGTGLPEVVTSLVSRIRGRDDVAIGNVIGSNLFNMLGILGINGLIAPLPIAPEIIASDNWWMLGITILLFPLMFTSRRIARKEGALLFGVYLGYMGILLGR